LSIAFEEGETRCVIRLEGDVDITCSDDLKRMLIEAISSRKELQVDLVRATDLDVTALQLLWAATCEAGRIAASVAVAGSVPDGIGTSVRDAGFKTFPIPVRPEACPAASAGSPTENATECADDR
jgi:hypothetical protein